MKINYTREDDVMVLKVPSDTIDFAEEMGPIIVFSAPAAKSIIKARDGRDTGKDLRW